MKLIVLFLLLMLMPTYTVNANQVENYVRVGLLERFNGVQSIKINNTDIVYGQSHFSSANGFTVQIAAANQVALYNGVQQLAVEGGSMQIADAFGGLVVLGDRSYRGMIDFVVSGSGLTAINTILMDEYLFSVVPSEMPSSWHMEALKAQAVVARTYAYFTIENSVHRAAGANFDLCDSVHCQSYQGAGWETQATTEAVLATSGIVAFYDGRPINAVYSASSGGATENSEDVWLEALPYLRSVPDTFEYEVVVWDRTFSYAEITNLLRQNNYNIGTAINVSIGGLLPSGRVESLVIDGTGGQAVLRKEAIRTFFSHSDEGSLSSRFFTLEGGQSVEQPANVAIIRDENVVNVSVSDLYVKDSRNSTDVIVVTDGFNTVVYGKAIENKAASATDRVEMRGLGYGHGVGLSQRGAQARAIMGYSFIEILEHYYTGIEVRS